MDWQSFVPFIPFFASFFGVLAAFLFQWLGRRYDRRQDRKKFLKDIKRELETSSILLTGTGQLLPTDMWESGKSSGFLRLLSYEVKIKLAQTYFAVDSHNYEAEKVRDVGIQSQLTWDEKPKYSADPMKFWALLSTRAVETEKSLKKHIDDLLKEDIWE